MIPESPLVDKRTREDVDLQVRTLLGRAVPGWPERPSDDAADGLIAVFAQYCDTIINRLNRAPQKNFLAFLDMLGASPQPAEAARVPLTFHLAPKARFATVPALTQVAAALKKGEEQPVLFETERELVVTSSHLASLAVKNGPADTYDDHSKALERPEPEGFSAFQPSTPVEHQLYIDVALPSPPPVIQQLRLLFELDQAANPPAQNPIQWEVWDGAAAAFRPLPPVTDETQQLTRNGEILFESLPPFVEWQIDRYKGYWLRCRTLRPVTNPRVPVVRKITVRTDSVRKGLAVEGVLTNNAVADPTKDLFPFGAHPAFGDTLYLANMEAFSKTGAAVTLHIAITNPMSGGIQSPVPPVAARAVRLRWEVWDGARWITTGISESGRAVRDESAGFSDTTKALTESGDVTFRLPPVTSPLKLNGLNSWWLRVRLVDGDYGRPAGYEKGRDGSTTVIPPTYSPPVIGSILLEYDLRLTAPPRRLLTYNDFTLAEVAPDAGSFRPFVPPADQYACCYFGFTSDGAFSERSMSIYIAVGNPPARKAVLDMAMSAPALVWEYWNGSAWTPWTIIDDTNAFRRSGTIRFLAPRDFATRSEFGQTAYWLRVRAQSAGAYDPRLRLVLLNTTMASQGITMRSEVLGSSNGNPNQTFRISKRPVLTGQQLEVLEPGLPSAWAQRMIRELEGDDAIRRSDPTDTRGVGFWVRWHEVPNFNGSGPRDRHYTIDREAGEVVFGDGSSGRIPSPGTKNIVMSRYRVGGGSAGNREAHTIEQLRSAIPYVDRVTNPESSGGGADAESVDDLISRAPRTLRHRCRAVTAQDFEDLAILASREVARARAVPLYDLAADPDTVHPRPGVVSLIIAPVAEGSAFTPERPMPGMELVRRVRDYLDQHRLTEAELVIVGPEYIAIQVETEVTVSDVDTASEVALAVSRALSRFLHPCLGRSDGAGWNFGEVPVVSDLYALIEDIPGVDHVRGLKLTRLEERPGAYKTGYFLVCSAEPRVTVTLEK